MEPYKCGSTEALLNKMCIDSSIKSKWDILMELLFRFESCFIMKICRFKTKIV